MSNFIAHDGVKGKREGLKFVTTLPGDEVCVSMMEFKGSMFIATNKHIYELVDKELNKIPIESFE